MVPNHTGWFLRFTPLLDHIYAHTALLVIQRLPRFRKVWIRADGPGVNYAALHIEEEGPIADAKEGVAAKGLGLVVKEQFSRPLQPFIGQSGCGQHGEENQRAFHGSR